MVSEEYIELPHVPSIDGGGENQVESFILQEVNREDSKVAGGDKSIGVLEDGNEDSKNKADKGEDEMDTMMKDESQDECEMTPMRSSLDGENGSAFVEESKKPKNDITHRSGAKRARLSYTDDQPCVQVFYNCLPRESKKKLGELLQNWSEWHSQYVANAKLSTVEPLECGDEIYFPALQVGGENASTMTFWMDKPTKQNIREGMKDDLPQEKEEDVPYYDRACALLPLTLQNGVENSECEELPAEASRCFNCGSYSHSLKDCSKRRDNTAITNARNQYVSKRGQNSGPRCPQRYYHNSPRGKFEGLKPGILGSETRQSLGIGELDPPPWLNRMRELGYPPGYLDSDGPDEPSGIVIYADDDKKELLEEGELVENELSKPTAKARMTVPFPGINAPIPENADERIWEGSVIGYDDPKSGQKSDTRLAHSSSSSLSAMERGRFDQARPLDYNSLSDEPPGTEYPHPARGNNVSSPNYLNESQRSNFRYHFSPSPSLTRSVSDSGRRTPYIQENSPRTLPVQGSSPRYGEHGWSSYGQYSNRSPAQYSSRSPGRYSSGIHSSGSSDHVHPERRHSRSDSYAAVDAKQKRERSEGSHYHRR